MKKLTYLTLPVVLVVAALGLFLWLASPTDVAAGACSVPGDHPTIQGAVNDAACNIINVSAATYNENVVITRSLSIIGAGTGSTFVDGGGGASVFTIDPGLTVTLESVAIQNGSDVDGGGVYNDDSHLTLSDTLIIDNVASAFGGGVYNTDGTVQFTGTDVISNEAGMSGGGLYNLNGRITINSSQFNDNDALAVNGGGVYQAFVSATLDINNSGFRNNSAANDGGGVYSSGGETTIVDSNFTINNAVDNGGGLVNDTVGTLAVFNTDFISNSATFGGGMYTTGTITVSHSLFLGNRAVDQTFTSGGGGGLFNIGNGSVETSRFLNNTAFSSSGAIFNNGDLFVRQTTADNNQAISGTGNGGGMSNFNNLTIEASTISNNSAIDGGGLFNLGLLIMENSTISNNSANGGGGLQNRGPAIVRFSTFYSNTAIAGGGILAVASLVDLNSSIVALNPGGGDCQLAGGIVASLDYNLDSDNSCNLGQPNDLPATPPLLGPLQDNGGWTATHALLPGSAGIDDGDTGGCLPTDQRDFPRPLGSDCDMGAYEAGAVLYLPVSLKA